MTRMRHAQRTLSPVLVILSLLLAAGQGCSPQEPMTPSPEKPAPQVTPPQLHVASFDRVLSFTNPATLTGDIPPATDLAGPQTQLSGALGVVVNATGQLLVVNSQAPSITRYDHAAATGDLMPVATVQGQATLLNFPTSMTIDTPRDLLYVGNQGSGRITVYANATQSSFSGDLAPVRVITSGSLPFLGGIYLTADDDLYVARGTEIQVFAKASTLDGNVQPDRTIINNTAAGGTGIGNVFVDAADNLYATNGFFPAIFVFRNASSLNGTAAADLTIAIQGARDFGAITVDSKDVGYVSDARTGTIYILDHISTRSGTVVPTGAIQGAGTQLNAPAGLFLVE